MKVCVQCASSGSPAKAAAIEAATGARHEHAPAAERQPDQQAEAEKDAEQPHRSDAFQVGVEVERRALAEVAAVRVEERLAARRPSSRSMQRNAHSVIILEE